MSNYYAQCLREEPLRNPLGPRESESRVLRGGCFLDDDLDNLRGSARFRNYPHLRSDDVGFRVVCVA